MYKKICERDTFIVSIVIVKPEASDGGQWRCNAFNPHGDSNANISLNFESEYIPSFGFVSRPLIGLVLQFFFLFL